MSNRPIASLDKILCGIFSKYIRLRDSTDGYFRCITCGKYCDTKYGGDAGHFITRDAKSTKFDEINCNAQCIQCNRFKSGKQYEHGLAIDKKYGEGTAEKLLIKSKQLTKRDRFDYEYLIKEYRAKLKALENEKHYKF